MGRCEAFEIIDCHVHLSTLDGISNLRSICDHLGFERMNIVCTISREDVNANPAAFVAKAEFPERFFLFAGLDHSSFLVPDKVEPLPLSKQVDRLMAIGVDGIKMIEGKPTTRKWLDIPLDSEYFEGFFARLEETGLPLLWHVADPEEFWDPGKAPSWARERGWTYDESFVGKEQLYAEVENVLYRHPNLRIVFAHFFFLSADLPRLSDLFERFKGVHVDLAPGIELLYNMSREVERARDFLIKYSDRILFGTDISSEGTVEEAKVRSGIVRRWLETGDEYRIPEGADPLLGPPEDGVMRGLALPAEVLANIYHENFVRLIGGRPKELNIELAAEECDRIAREVGILKGVSPENTLAMAAAVRLRGKD